MRLLRLTPWRRGPRLLASRPGVALALLAAAAVAALPAAAAPLFLSSAQHATLHRQIDQTCPWQVGAQFSGPVAPPNTLTFTARLGPDSVVGVERYHQREAALAAKPVPGLTPPVNAGYADVDAEPVGRELPLPDLSGVRLLTRTGFADHVQVLAGPVGEGLWLPHEHAELQGIEIGDQLRLTARSGSPGTWTPPETPNVIQRPFQEGPGISGPDPEPVTLPVTAIYRDLRTLPESPYWCGVEDGYLGTPQERSNPNVSILPMALVDTDTFLAAGRTTRSQPRQIVGLAPVDPQLTAPVAARLAGDIEELRARMFAEHPKLFPAGRSTDQTEFESSLDRYQRRAALVRSGLLPPVLPITGAGTLVGLAVAAAAAIFWVQRRRRELTVLAAHGVGAGGLGVKAVLEALPAVLGGTAAGWAAGGALVVRVGPSPVLAPGALPLSAVAAAVTGLVALGLIGGLAAARARGLTDTRPVSHGVGWWRRVPWELALVAAAPAAWLWLGGDGKIIDTAAGGVGEVAHVPARLLVAPILAITGLAVLAARLGGGWLRARGASRTASRAPGSPARLLAWRRSVRVAATTAILGAATAVPVAMATFGATATDSIRTTADAQLRFGLGSDTVVSYDRELDREMEGLPPPPPVPEPMTDRATEVLRLNQQRLDGLTVDVLGVDPDTFSTGAFWDDRIPGDTLQDATDQLAARGLPVVVASRRIPPGPATLEIHDEQIQVLVAATRPLPGAQPAYPLLLVHREMLETRLPEDALATFWQQVWVSGDPDRTRAEIAEAQLPLSRITSIDDQRTGAVYEPVTYTFQYLIALSVFTGLITAVGLLLYLESRTATHRRAYVMLRRLGLRPGAHRRALLLEVGGPVVAGLAAGIAGSVALAYGLRGGFDVDPDQFPRALLDLPITMTAAVCAVAAAVAVAASLLAHTRITRANPAEVLRDTA